MACSGTRRDVFSELYVVVVVRVIFVVVVVFVSVSFVTYDRYHSLSFLGYVTIVIVISPSWGILQRQIST